MNKTILSMLHKIEKEKTIYNIHYCIAGVGFIFYEPPEGYSRDYLYQTDEWEKYLSVQNYYPTFEEAVKAEFKRLKTK